MSPPGKVALGRRYAKSNTKRRRNKDNDILYVLGRGFLSLNLRGRVSCPANKEKKMSWYEQMAKAYEDGLKAGREDKAKGVINDCPPRDEDFKSCWLQGYCHGRGITERLYGDKR